MAEGGTEMQESTKETPRVIEEAPLNTAEKVANTAETPSSTSETHANTTGIPPSTAEKSPSTAEKSPSTAEKSPSTAETPASTALSIQEVLKPGKYCEIEPTWPAKGRVILARYDEECVVVYQSFKPEIVDYAVKHQRFGGPDFSFDRMSWIKTNFLWMMYRCGWASKRYQERVVAVRITHEGFREILQHAYTPQRKREENVGGVRVNLQWDPDHTPTKDKCIRRAIQLGLKKEVLQKYGTEWVRSITDITDFVQAQRPNTKTKEGLKHLLVPHEHVYVVAEELQRALQMDVVNEREAHKKPHKKQTFKRRGNKNR